MDAAIQAEEKSERWRKETRKIIFPVSQLEMNLDGSYSTICAQVNSAFEVRQLMKYLNWHADKIVKSGDVYLAFCPIHREEIFRTLVLNPRNNTYHCKHHNCPGSQPADFIDLLARCSGKSIPVSIDEVVKHFGADYFRLSKRQVEIVTTLAIEAEDGPEAEKPPTA